MVGEIFASLGAFKTMFDMAKALKDINDSTIRNGAVIELQEQILAAQEAQSTLIEKVSELEKEVARFETWDAEKQRYEMKQVEPGAIAYSLKKDEQETEPPHWICTDCYQNRRKSVLQSMGEWSPTPWDRLFNRWQCHSCKASIKVSAKITP